MTDLSFDVDLSWAAAGREGAGHISGGDVELEWSVPATMGGRGAGSNLEELLVAAVAACYSATLAGVLRRAGLPHTQLRVAATGTVAGYPERARFARLVVSPTVAGGDLNRTTEYLHAAEQAHDRCFIGGTLAPHVDYRVGSVRVEPAAVAA